MRSVGAVPSTTGPCSLGLSWKTDDRDDWRGGDGWSRPLDRLVRRAAQRGRSTYAARLLVRVDDVQLFPSRSSIIDDQHAAYEVGTFTGHSRRLFHGHGHRVQACPPGQPGRSWRRRCTGRHHATRETPNASPGGEAFMAASYSVPWPSEPAHRNSSGVTSVLPARWRFRRRCRWLGSPAVTGCVRPASTGTRWTWAMAAAGGC
jgi:hypothetical protein